MWQHKFKLTFLTLVVALNCYLYLSGNTHLYKAVWYNFVDIDDYKIFYNDTIKASSNPTVQPLSSRFSTIADQPTLDSLKQHKSVAFVVMQQDSVIAEQYWENYTDVSKSNSFSVAKSVVSLLIGAAIEDGKIKSVDDPVQQYLPDYKHPNMTIQHVLTMSSGLDWDESYAGPFSITTKGYYGTDLRSLIMDLDTIEPAGEVFKYLSGNTQLLAFILEAAIDTSMHIYAQQKLWEPLGMHQDALWSLDDKHGNEKAYCCISTNARDFAKIGQLINQNGVWQGKRIIDSLYLVASLQGHGLIDLENNNVDYYGYQWWIIPEYKGLKIVYARGILGQFIICIPEKDMVIVRLGHERGTKKDEHHYLTYQMIDYALSISD